MKVLSANNRTLPLKGLEHQLSIILSTKLFVLFSFFALSFMIFQLFSPIVSSNAETENTAKVSTPAGTISLATEDNVTINITPTPTQKIYSKTTALKITNSCKKGATITLSTNKSHNNLERQGTDTLTKTIASIATTGNLTDNSWGYTLDNTTYSKVPTKDQSPATIYNTNTATASTTTPENLNLTYAVKTDDTIPSGTYTNDLVYTVNVKPECLQYTLKFNLDNGTGKPGATYTDRQLSYGTKVNLADFTPTRTDYEFMGWIAITNNPATTSTIYNPTANLDVNPTNETEVTLTAKWKLKPKGIYTISSMQQMNPNICKANTTPLATATQLDTDGSHHGDPNYVPTKTLTDTRDNNTYTVSKLADGKCWMTQNLRIINKTITPADSDTTTNFTVPVSDRTSFGYYSQSNFNAYLDNTYGGYYTWYTATAGTGTYGMRLTNASGSICPKGWRLPTGGNSGEFQALYNNYNSPSALISGPAKIGLGGAVDMDKSIYFQGTIGNYWTSTAANNNISAFMLALSETNVQPYYELGKDHGYQIRCVAEDKLSLDNIANMQDMTPEVCANTKEHQVATLKDVRDGNTYAVAKLKDGKCWMTQNLRIIDKTITPADSDVTSNYTIPASSLNGGATYDTSRAYLDNTYGGYYIWYTATAGTGTTAMDMRGLNTISSICPKGWRLPTGGNGGEFNILYNNYGTSILYAPFNFTLHGDTMFGGAVGGAGTNGAYWSSTTDVTILSDNLYLSYGFYINVPGSRYLPVNGFSRGYGHAVRCLAR